MSERKSLLFTIIKKLARPLRGKDLNRFYAVRFLLNTTLRLFKPKVIPVDGHRLFLDKDDSLRLSIVGVYEPLMTKKFRKAIRRGSLVIDIGAHIGYYTLSAAKRVGKTGQVISFEPSDDNFRILEENVKINGYKNVVLVKKAVSKETKKTKLFLSSINEAHHSLVEKGDGHILEVDAVSLDDYLKNTQKDISVIKMDIEGGEYLALQGMKEVLRKHRELTLFTEFSPLSLSKSGTTPERFIETLSGLGFDLYVINEASEKIEPVVVRKLLSSKDKNRDWHVNLMGIKRNKSSKRYSSSF